MGGPLRLDHLRHTWLPPKPCSVGTIQGRAMPGKVVDKFTQLLYNSTTLAERITPTPSSVHAEAVMQPTGMLMSEMTRQAWEPFR